MALAANGPYFCGLLVTACSIAEHARRDVALRFNVLDGGIADADWAFFRRRIAELHPHVSFNPIPVDERLFAEYPVWNGNRMAYARLMLPTALPDVDWIVYCDVDFLWFRDVAELWALRDDALAFIGVQDLDLATRTSEKEWFEARGYPFDMDDYFCSGLCFMNLEAFRAEGLVAKIKDVLDTHKDVQFPDQAALNIVTWGRRKLVDGRWQCFTQRLTQADLNAGVVVHHAGEIPWKKTMGGKGVQFLSDSMLLWHRANARYRGISTWQSLRMHFSASWIVGHRLATLVFRLPFVKLPLKWLLETIRHPGVWGNMDMRARRLREAE